VIILTPASTSRCALFCKKPPPDFRGVSGLKDELETSIRAYLDPVFFPDAVRVGDQTDPETVHQVKP
jgi:hypothetical protein